MFETFLDPAQHLHLGIPDVMEIVEIVAVSSRSQSDTERSVKVTKMVMKDRYRGKHDEQKAVAKALPREDGKDEDSKEAAAGARDRANEEVFISQNGDSNLRYFPDEDVYRKCSAQHMPAQMSTVDRPSTTIQNLDNKPKRQQFW